MHDPKSNDLWDKGWLIKETFIAISHTFSRETTNPHLPFVPIRISTHPSVQGQCHEIFDLWFFRQSITPRPQMNILKYFRILFRIRWEINENVLIPRYAP
jgi:hypothetical protein